MIPKSCKRLAEVDFPIAEVSRHAAREKSIRHGHPSTLHLWWARRPLASSRAVLMALLLPDPCDANCPPSFKTDARKALLAMKTRPSGWDEQVKTDEGLRRALLKFIADFANWDNAAKTEYLETGRGLVRAAHPEETPLVVDPFAGGGSIPLEALRLGLRSLRQRPQPRRLPHPQGDAGRHPPPWSGPRQGTAQGWRGNQGQGRKGVGRPLPQRTRTAQRPSPTSGRGRCAANRPTAARRFP